MEKIKDYTDRFFKGKPQNRNYSLSSVDVLNFMKEFQLADGNGRFHEICTLFNYGYAKGYRAALAEMKKGDARA